MRDLVSVARRLLETRKSVRELERQAGELASQGQGLNTLLASRLLVFRGALQALAWALEIDLDQMDSPPLSNLLANEHPSGVRLHRVDMGSLEPGGSSRILWLTEMPPHRDPLDAGFSTEYWSFFLSDAQARDLYRALGETLPLPTFPVCTLPTPQPARPSQRAAAPTGGTRYRSGTGPNGADVITFPALPAAPRRPPQQGA